MTQRRDRGVPPSTVLHDQGAGIVDRGAPWPPTGANGLLHGSSPIRSSGQPEPERHPLGGGLELWTLGPVATAMPELRDDYSPRLRAALIRRRDATLTGRCVCGGTIAAGRPLTPGVAAASIEHEPECDAIDERLATLLRAEARR